MFNNVTKSVLRIVHTFDFVSTRALKHPKSLPSFLVNIPIELPKNRNRIFFRICIEHRGCGRSAVQDAHQHYDTSSHRPAQAAAEGRKDLVDIQLLYSK